MEATSHLFHRFQHNNLTASVAIERSDSETSKGTKLSDEKKMGLLTDPKSRERMVRIVSQHNNKLCCMCYMVGLAWFLALAYKPFNAGTYFSENALLPGLVQSDFYNDHGASDLYRSLKEEIKKLSQRDSKDETRYHSPVNWLESHFRGIGLETYTQNYSFVYPAGILKNQVFEGRNVYGILRAPRAASTEALVLSAPFRPLEMEMEKTTGGIALLIAMAKAFRRHTYWAKDIIFLVSEHDTIGMQAWLMSYHNEKLDYIVPGELHGRSGSIQAAINLEIPLDSISKFNIKLEGVNGQLPNLDLVNTVVRLCRREGIIPSLQKRADHWGPETREGFESNLRTMLLMMWNQISGSPSGVHGLFHRYNIEAVTLQGIRTKNSRKSAGFLEIGRVVEGVFRSLNNLLERFHQSFFFYLLPATDRYVSIGLYMPPFGLLALPVLIKAVALWISYQYEEQGESEPESQKKEDDEKKEMKDETSYYTDDEDEDDDDERKEAETKKKKKHKKKAANKESTASEEKPKEDCEEKNSGDTKKQEDNAEQVKSTANPLVIICPWVIMSIIFGLVAHNGTKFTVDTAYPFHMPPGEGLTWGALALLFSAMIFPRLLVRKAKEKGNRLGPNPYLMKSIALLTLGMLLGAMSVLNISLAFFLAVIWVPVVLTIWPRTNRVSSCLQYIILLLISPLSVVYICSVFQHLMENNFVVSDARAIHTAAWQYAQKVLLNGVVDRYMIGNMTYSLVTMAIFPTWVLFWSVQWASV